MTHITETNIKLCGNALLVHLILHSFAMIDEIQMNTQKVLHLPAMRRVPTCSHNLDSGSISLRPPASQSATQCANRTRGRCVRNGVGMLARFNEASAKTAGASRGAGRRMRNRALNLSEARVANVSGTCCHKRRQHRRERRKEMRVHRTERRREARVLRRRQYRASRSSTQQQQLQMCAATLTKRLGESTTRKDSRVVDKPKHSLKKLQVQRLLHIWSLNIEGIRAVVRFVECFIKMEALAINIAILSEIKWSGSASFKCGDYLILQSGGLYSGFCFVLHRDIVEL